MRTRKSKRTVTSVDVAKAAGVSQSTVSRAFDPHSGLSKELRKTVMQVAEQVGYRPNAIARSLSSRKTGIIGLVTLDSESPFMCSAVNKLTMKLQENDLQTLTFIANLTEGVGVLLDRMLQYRVDAFVVLGATMTSNMVMECSEYDMPMVLFNRYIPHANVSAVCCNETQGARAAAELFVEKGYLRPAYVCGDQDATTNINRQAGFISRLAELGIAKCSIEYGGYTFNGGMEAAEKLLNSDNPPDAVFCVNDIAALGVMDYIRYVAKKKIPDDIGVIGFDDIGLAASPSYSLTTIQQPLDEMVSKTVEAIKLSIENRKENTILQLIEAKMVIRSSVRV